MEKAYKLGKQIYIHTESAEQMQQMDDLLWKFREGSFIPHHDQDHTPRIKTPVTIGYSKDIDLEADVLVNLGQDIPSFFSQFERVAELVNEDPDFKSQARDRYTFYRDRGYELNTHKLWREE